MSVPVFIAIQELLRNHNKEIILSVLLTHIFFWKCNNKEGEQAQLSAEDEIQTNRVPTSIVPDSPDHSLNS